MDGEWEAYEKRYFVDSIWNVWENIWTESSSFALPLVESIWYTLFNKQIVIRYEVIQ